MCEWSPAKLCLHTTSAHAGCCNVVVLALVPCIVDGCLFKRNPVPEKCMAV